MKGDGHLEINEHMQECQEALQKLIGKTIVDIRFKPQNSDCWRLYITTDTGKMVMTFCKDWMCPVVEHRNKNP